MDLELLREVMVNVMVAGQMELLILPAQGKVGSREVLGELEASVEPVTIVALVASQQR